MSAPLEEPRVIGLIAGSGSYPGIFARAAKARGARLALAALKGDAPESLPALADATEWIRVGQLGKLIRFFKKQGAREAVMAGRVTPGKLYDLRPDLRVVKILARLKERNAETLFGAVADELEKEGIALLPATTFLDDFLPAPGHVCGPALSDADLEDLSFGFRVAKETSRLDIGQSVVVREGTVLAVEAFEGTNACIRRGGELARGKNAKLAKVSKPGQDFRFDVPVVGPDTIRNCHQSGVTAVAVEAGRTLLLDQPEIERLCAKHRVSLHALDPASGGKS